MRLIKEAQNTNSVDKLRKLVGMPVDNNNYLCDTNFLRYRKRKLTGGYLNLETSRLTDWTSFAEDKSAKQNVDQRKNTSHACKRNKICILDSISYNFGVELNWLKIQILGNEFSHEGFECRRIGREFTLWYRAQCRGKFGEVCCVVGVLLRKHSRRPQSFWYIKNNLTGLLDARTTHCCCKRTP